MWHSIVYIPHQCECFLSPVWSVAFVLHCCIFSGQPNLMQVPTFEITASMTLSKDNKIQPPATLKLQITEGFASCFCLFLIWNEANWLLAVASFSVQSSQWFQSAKQGISRNVKLFCFFFIRLCMLNHHYVIIWFSVFNYQTLADIPLVKSASYCSPQQGRQHNTRHSYRRYSEWNQVTGLICCRQQTVYFYCHTDCSDDWQLMCFLDKKI